MLVPKRIIGAFVALMMLAAGLMPCHQFAIAKDPAAGAKPISIPIKILSRTGAMKIVNPNGSSLLVLKDKAITKIVPGSKIEMITGEAVIKIRGLTITIGRKESIRVFLNSAGEIAIGVITGKIEVVDASGKKVVLSNNMVFNTATNSITRKSSVFSKTTDSHDEQPEQLEIDIVILEETAEDTSSSGDTSEEEEDPEASPFIP